MPHRSQPCPGNTPAATETLWSSRARPLVSADRGAIQSLAANVHDRSFGSVQITASIAEEPIDRFIATICPEMQNKHSASRPS